MLAAGELAAGHADNPYGCRQAAEIVGSHEGSCLQGEGCHPHNKRSVEMDIMTELSHASTHVPPCFVKVPSNDMRKARGAGNVQQSARRPSPK
jgi:hypothetical protein